MERIKEWYAQKTERATQMLIDHGVIAKEDKVIYQYGIAQIGYVLLYVLSYLVIALLTGNLWLLSWYLVCFTVLRVSAGGFHLKKRYTCYFLTMGCVLGISLLLKQEEMLLPLWGQVVLFALSCAVIFRLAPIDTPNRRVDAVEYRVYRRRTLVFLGLEIIIYILLQLGSLGQEAFAVFLAAFQEMLFLCLGKREIVSDK